MPDETFTYRPEQFVHESKHDDSATGPPVEYVREAYAKGAIADDALDDEIEWALTTDDFAGLTWNERGDAYVAFEGQVIHG
jgi:hypothetical protein